VDSAALAYELAFINCKTPNVPPVLGYRVKTYDDAQSQSWGAYLESSRVMEPNAQYVNIGGSEIWSSLPPRYNTLQTREQKLSLYRGAPKYPDRSEGNNERASAKCSCTCSVGYYEYYCCRCRYIGFAMLHEALDDEDKVDASCDFHDPIETSDKISTHLC
jgi:hypothetical protein